WSVDANSRSRTTPRAAPRVGAAREMTPRAPGGRRRCTKKWPARKRAIRERSTLPARRLLAVVVRVAGDRALDRVAHALPCVARGVLRAVPLEAGGAARARPVRAELRIDV